MKTVQLDIKLMVCLLGIYCVLAIIMYIYVYIYIYVLSI